MAESLLLNKACSPVLQVGKLRHRGKVLFLGQTEEPVAMPPWFSTAILAP